MPTEPAPAVDEDDAFDATKITLRKGVPSMHDNPEYWERQHAEAMKSLNEMLTKS